MSDYRNDDLQPRHGGSANVWSLAALSAAIFLCSLLGAKVLSTLVEKHQLTRAAYDRAVREAMAKGRPVPERQAAMPGAGVDTLPTGTIRPQPAPVSPCGEEKGVGRPRN